MRRVPAGARCPSFDRRLARRVAGRRAAASETSLGPPGATRWGGDRPGAGAIGDGTAAFYNYIYLTIAGFTEDESMLANMVREGHVTRDEALRRAAEYSKPRWDSLREYAQLIGFSFEEAMQAINAAPKLY